MIAAATLLETPAASAVLCRYHYRDSTVVVDPFAVATQFLRSVRRTRQNLKAPSGGQVVRLATNFEPAPPGRRSGRPRRRRAQGCAKQARWRRLRRSVRRTGHQLPFGGRGARHVLDLSYEGAQFVVDGEDAQADRTLEGKACLQQRETLPSRINEARPRASRSRSPCRQPARQRSQAQVESFRQWSLDARGSLIPREVAACSLRTGLKFVRPEGRRAPRRQCIVEAGIVAVAPAVQEPEA